PKRPSSIHSGGRFLLRPVRGRGDARGGLRKVQLLQDALVLVEVYLQRLTVQLKSKALVTLVNLYMLRARTLHGRKFNINRKTKDCGRVEFGRLCLCDIERERVRSDVIDGAHTKLWKPRFINPL